MRKQTNDIEAQGERRYGANGDLTLEEFQHEIDSRPRTQFISGYRDLTETDFAQHYHNKLDRTITRGDSFIMANSGTGVEVMALAYLKRANVSPERITIYSLQPVAEADSQETDTLTGYRTKTIVGGTADRDIALTKDSDCDILWLRGEDEGWSKGMSATGVLNVSFELGPKENARRRSAIGIERIMAWYDDIV